MNNLLKINRLPYLVLGCGLLGFLLRYALYATAVDDHGLMLPGHYLHILIWGFSLLVAAVLLCVVRTLDGNNRYEDNFPASVLGGIGSIAAGLCLILTVTKNLVGFPYLDNLTKVWVILGLFSSVCLFAAGIFRIQGKRPFFGFHGVVCVFFALHLANQYRVWSGSPQTSDFIFQLLACIFFTLSAYYQAAFDVGMGQRRHQLFIGMMGTFLSCLALVKADAPLLYLGFGLWTLTNLCALNPPSHLRPTASAETTGEVE